MVSCPLTLALLQMAPAVSALRTSSRFCISFCMASRSCRSFFSRSWFSSASIELSWRRTFTPSFAGNECLQKAESVRLNAWIKNELGKCFINVVQ